MNEPVFVTAQPSWATPWSGNWSQFGFGPLSPLPSLSSPQPAVPASGHLVSPALSGKSAPMLLAAVALNRGQPNGPTNDQDVEELMYDTLELISGAGDVDVRCESGRLTLTGAVSHKRLKRDIGELAWAIPSLADVQNNITIVARRRSRGFGKESEPQAVGAGRKQT